jgi:hypothetical protein
VIRRRRRRKAKQYEILNLLWGTGIAMMFFVASVLQSWHKFAELFAKDQLHFWLSVVVAVVSFSLFIAYAVATHHELNLMRDYLGETDAPRIMPKTYIVVVLLALVFGALVTVSDKILLYSMILVTYNLADLWGNWQVARMLAPIIRRAEARNLDQEDRRAVETMRDFYFQNPTLPRIVTMMFFNWAAVCLAVSFHFTGLPAYRNASYALVLLTTIGGEAVIQWWRFRSIYKLD